MRAFIYTGGPVYPDNITTEPDEEDLVIAADSGYKNALALGVKRIDIFLGDMDSIGAIQPPEGAEVLQVPAEKDATDTQIAAEMDHTMANLGLLEDLWEKQIFTVICNGRNRVHFIRNNSILIPRSKYKYLGLISVDERCRGVSVEGCKYEMKNRTLTRRQAFATSNELTGNCALVAVRKGGLLVIESMD